MRTEGAVSLLRQVAPDRVRGALTLVVPTGQLDPAPWLADRARGLQATRELVRSVWMYGMPHPLIARPMSRERYELIAEPELLAAARATGLTTVQILVVDIDSALGRAIELAARILDPRFPQPKEVKSLRRLQRFLEEAGVSAQPHALAELLGRDERRVEALLGASSPRSSESRRG